MKRFLSYIAIYILSAKCAEASASETSENEKQVLSKLLCVGELADLNWDEKRNTEDTNIWFRNITTRDMLFDYITEKQNTATEKLDPKKLVEAFRAVKEYCPKHTKAEEYIRTFCELCAKLDFAEVCKITFGLANGGYMQYVYRYTDKVINAAASPTDIRKDVVHATEESICEYFEILNSVYGLDWGSQPKSYDDKDVNLTKPGLKIVVRAKQSPAMREIKRKLADKMLLETDNPEPNNACANVCVLQGHIFTLDNFTPVTLPLDYVAALNKYLQTGTGPNIQKFNASVAGAAIKLTKILEVYGYDYASHLVVHIDCGNIHGEIQAMAKKLNFYILWWNMVFREASKVCLKNSECGWIWLASKRASGWVLITDPVNDDRPIRKVVLGVLKSESEAYNEAARQENGNCNVPLNPMLSECAGSASNNDAVRRKETLGKRLMPHCAITSESASASFSQLYSLISSIDIFITADRRKAYFERKGSEIKEEVSDILAEMSGEELEVVGLSVDVINANRIQDFEPTRE